MQSISINTNKIDRDALYKGKNGTYLNLTLMENRDGPDQYGNDGFIVQDIGKERRAAGEKGPIIGNWKHVGAKGRDRTPADTQYRGRPKQSPNAGADYPDGEDDIPFNRVRNITHF